MFYFMAVISSLWKRFVFVINLPGDCCNVWDVVQISADLLGMRED
jgi:hypothetical protein